MREPEPGFSLRVALASLAAIGVGAGSTVATFFYIPMDIIRSYCDIIVPVWFIASLAGAMIAWLAVMHATRARGHNGVRPLHRWHH